MKITGICVGTKEKITRQYRKHGVSSFQDFSSLISNLIRRVSFLAKARCSLLVFVLQYRTLKIFLFIARD